MGEYLRNEEQWEGDRSRDYDFNGLKKKIKRTCSFLIFNFLFCRNEILIKPSFLIMHTPAHDEARLVLRRIPRRLTNEREINRLLEIVTMDVMNVSRRKPGTYTQNKDKNTLCSGKATKLLFFFASLILAFLRRVSRVINSD